MSGLKSFKVCVKEPHPVNTVVCYYVIGNSKTQAKRQALAMAGYAAPYPTHRINHLMELETLS